MAIQRAALLISSIRRAQVFQSSRVLYLHALILSLFSKEYVPNAKNLEAKDAGKEFSAIKATLEANVYLLIDSS